MEKFLAAIETVRSWVVGEAPKPKARRGRPKGSKNKKKK